MCLLEGLYDPQLAFSRSSGLGLTQVCPNTQLESCFLGKRGAEAHCLVYGRLGYAKVTYMPMISVA